MTNLKKEILLPFTQSQLFALVNRVEDYPQFLPWCLSTNVFERSIDRVTANMVVGKAGFQESLTTVNTLIPEERITMRLLEGPFRRLEGIWEFTPVEGGCQVNLSLDFEFSNKLISLALKPVSKGAADKVLEAFCKRAQALYA
jgi:ribosome-associated toxin RatA of RatAB toxin-antitoxin module